MVEDLKYNERVDPIETRPKLDFLKDIKYIDQMISNFTDEILPRVAYYSLKWSDSKPDNIYNETDTKTFKSPFYIPVNAELNPPKKTLQTYGIDETRAIIFSIANIDLQRNNLNPKIGDQLQYDTLFYEVRNVVKDKFWQASLQPMEFKLFCDIVPERSKAVRS